MTKNEIGYIVKRYYFVNIAKEKNLPQAVFYKGNRKKVVEINEKVKTVLDVIVKVYESEKNNWMKFMIRCIMAGESDKYIMRNFPYKGEAYYARKKKFFNKVYTCCSCCGVVELGEALDEEIA